VVALEHVGTGAVVVADGGYGLLLGERGAGGERLIESVRAQRLAVAMTASARPSRLGAWVVVAGRG
jgi:hypothetical protein